MFLRFFRKIIQKLFTQVSWARLPFYVMEVMIAFFLQLSRSSMLAHSKPEPAKAPCCPSPAKAPQAALSRRRRLPCMPLVAVRRTRKVQCHLSLRVCLTATSGCEQKKVVRCSTENACPRYQTRLGRDITEHLRSKHWAPGYT